MTRDEFAERYRLLKKVTDRDASTYHALSASGAVVLVHVLNRRERPGNRSLLEAVERLPPAEHRRVIEVLEVDDTPVVVTKFITGFEALGTWLDERTPRPGPSSPAPPTGDAALRGMGAAPLGGEGSEPVPTGDDAPGEFTRLFELDAVSSDPPAAEPAAPPEATDEGSASSFTGLFRAAPDPGTPPVRSTPEQPSEPSAPQGHEDPVEPPAKEAPARSGESFTGLFRGAPPDRPSQAPPGPAGSSEPPEEPEPAEPARASEPPPLRFGDPPSASPPRRESPRTEGPGRFTRAFRSTGTPRPEVEPESNDSDWSWGSSPPPPEPDSPLFGEDDHWKERLRDPRSKRASPDRPSPTPEAPPPAGPPAPDGPGEYTRVISLPGGASTDPAPLVPPPLAPPRAPESGRSAEAEGSGAQQAGGSLPKWPLIGLAIVLVVALVTAVAVALLSG